MKRNIISGFILSVFFGATAFAQEGDDMYFTKSDRIKLKSEAISKIDARPKTETLTERPKFANPDYDANYNAMGGGALVGDEMDPMYNYYSESSAMDQFAAGNYRQSGFGNNMMGFGMNPMMMGGGMMMGSGMMMGNPWMRPSMMMGWNSMGGFRSGWGMSMGFGNPWMMGNPWMGGRMGMMGMYDPWMMGMYDPWMMGGMGMGMWGMNRWGYNPYMMNRPIVIVNNNSDNRNISQARQLRGNPSNLPSARPAGEQRTPARLRNYEGTRNYIQNRQAASESGRYGRTSGTNTYSRPNTNTRRSSDYNRAATPQRRDSFSTPSRSTAPTMRSNNFSSPSRGGGAPSGGRGMRRN